MVEHKTIHIIGHTPLEYFKVKVKEPEKPKQIKAEITQNQLNTLANTKQALAEMLAKRQEDYDKPKFFKIKNIKELYYEMKFEELRHMCKTCKKHELILILVQKENGQIPF